MYKHKQKWRSLFCFSVGSNCNLWNRLHFSHVHIRVLCVSELFLLVFLRSSEPTMYHAVQSTHMKHLNLIHGLVCNIFQCDYNLGNTVFSRLSILWYSISDIWYLKKCTCTSKTNNDRSSFLSFMNSNWCFIFLISTVDSLLVHSCHTSSISKI